ncbi:hypothetical protein HY358_02545 [Candidatus Roizmanbacteria bacterium]|nr:hypothetical protein [Candidatus Roizmanbacteria bacterium]
MIYFFSIVLVLFSIYSYSLIDLNLTLLNFPLWEQFRAAIIQIGYYQRDLSWGFYLIFLILLFVFHNIFLRRYKHYDPVRLSILIGAILLFSYPFLSHDIFNYIFDAKIVTYYHQNPYILKPLDFPQDEWLRFMHWTHRTYPYGPVFLPLTLIPSLLGMGKFLATFFLFKTMFVAFYILSTFMIAKLNKRWGMLFATSPFVLIEGVVNSHNDLVAVSLALVGIWYLFQNKSVAARLFLFLSGGIKYVTLPLIAITKSNKQLNMFLVIAFLLVIIYLSLFMEIQPWYFLSFFILLPWYEEFVEGMQMFFAGLLLSYYPFIRLGEWDTEKIVLKHTIIVVFLCINIVLFLAPRIRRQTS